MSKRKRPASSPEEDVVNMATLRELLDDQKKVFNSLMKQQERKYKSLVETTNKRLEDLTLEIVKMKPSRGSVSTPPPSPSFTMPKRKRNVPASSPEEDVSMSTLREFLDDQKKLFTNLMKQHESMYESFAKTTNKRLDDLALEVVKMKSTLPSPRSLEDSETTDCEKTACRLMKQKVQDMDREISKLRADTSSKVKGSDTWRLSVKGIDGDTYTLQIHKAATVDKLYKKISEKEGIRPEDLRILYKGVQLVRDGGKYLSEYVVNNWGSLCVVECQGPPLHRWDDPNEANETTDASDEDDSSDIWELFVHVSIQSRCYNIRMHKDAPVDELHQKISEESDIPIYQFRAVHRNKRMEFGLGKCLSDYIVKSPAGRLVYVIPPWDPWKQVALITRNTSALGVGYGSNIWQLFIRGFSGQINIRIHKDETVDKLYEVTSYWLGIPVMDHPRIMYGDKTLERGQGKFLSDYNVEDRSLLYMVQRLTIPNCYGVVDEDNQFPVCKDILELDVEGVCGKTKVIHIPKDATSDELLEMISRLFNIPVCLYTCKCIRIICACKELEYGQGKYLSDYGIQDKSVLVIVLRLCGGKCSGYKSLTCLHERKM